MSFLLGPTIYHYWNDPADNKNRIMEFPQHVGFDSAGVYTKKTYLGGKFGIVINNVNSELLPTRGASWDTEISSEFGVLGSSKNFTKITSDMTVYSSFKDTGMLVTVLRFGGGHIFSKNFEHFQALS